MARAKKKTRHDDQQVDLDAMKVGLEDALEQKKLEEDGNRTAAKEKYYRRLRRRQRPVQFSFNIADASLDFYDDDEYLEHFMLGLNP